MIADFLRSHNSATVMGISKQLGLPLPEVQSGIIDAVASLQDCQLQVLYTISGLDGEGNIQVVLSDGENHNLSEVYDRVPFAVSRPGERVDLMTGLQERMGRASIQDSSPEKVPAQKQLGNNIVPKKPSLHSHFTPEVKDNSEPSSAKKPSAAKRPTVAKKQPTVASKPAPTAVENIQPSIAASMPQEKQE